MKTLKLNVTREWFNKIASGEKKEEYRELNQYYLARFARCYKAGFSPCKFAQCAHGLDSCESNLRDDYTEVEFINGYRRDARRIIVEFKGISVGYGNREWGAPDRPVFIIKLGELKSKVFEL